MELVDSHCHLYYEPMLNNYEELIKNCRKKGINKLLTIGVNLETSILNSKLSVKYKEIYATVGLHPNNIDEFFNDEDYKGLINKNKKIIGIGETGLDYYRTKSNLDIQRKNFINHINLSEKCNLPLIVHTREAESDTIQLLKLHIKNPEPRLIIHCFTGTKDFAKKLLDFGAFISFSGIITFKKNNELREVVKYVPEDRILLETDSPYLSPEPHRGKKNTPQNLDIIASEVAKIKNINEKMVYKITTNNFNKIFKLI